MITTKKVVIPIILVINLILLFPLAALSHSGRTDASGGHKDKNNVSGLGSYHYHHGYSAHLHPNGNCPYENSNNPSPKTMAKINYCIQVDGLKLQCTSNPYEKDGCIMVPMRSIFEALGAQVNWDEPSQTVSASKGETSLCFKIGASTAQVNGETKAMQPISSIQNNATMVPIRFVAESLGATVNYNSTIHTVDILSN